MATESRESERQRPLNLGNVRVIRAHVATSFFSVIAHERARPRDCVHDIAIFVHGRVAFLGKPNNIAAAESARVGMKPIPSKVAFGRLLQGIRRFPFLVNSGQNITWPRIIIIIIARGLPPGEYFRVLVLVVVIEQAR